MKMIILKMLYVDNQTQSSAFYTRILQQTPVIDVPGMTAFQLNANCKLGLMPNKGIVKILEDKTPHPDLGIGIPRCELYLYVENIQTELNHALQCGARLISPILQRDWGDMACYMADPDGHIIAYAEKIKQ